MFGQSHTRRRRRPNLCVVRPFARWIVVREVLTDDGGGDGGGGGGDGDGGCSAVVAVATASPMLLLSESTENSPSVPIVKRMRSAEVVS